MSTVRLRSLVALAMTLLVLVALVKVA